MWTENLPRWNKEKREKEVKFRIPEFVFRFSSPEEAKGSERKMEMAQMQQSKSPVGEGSKQKKDKFYIRFARQELKAGWKPVPTAGWAMTFFFLLAVVFVPLGSVFLAETLDIVELRERYDDKGEFAGKSNPERERMLQDENANFDLEVSINITEKMEGPVYVYYELSNFYQNHKRYVRSLDSDQLAGESRGASSLRECQPQRFQSGTKNLVNPCGLLPWSYFNDTFNATLGSTGEQLRIRIDDIAWEWDRKYLYGSHIPFNFNNDSDLRGGATITGPLDEEFHFHVWMRVAARPTVRKLFGEIERDLEEGEVLRFRVANRYNTYGFDGRKYIVISTKNWTGGRNVLVGVVYIVVGCLSFVITLGLMFGKMKFKREFGDLSNLSWKKHR